MSSKYPAFTVNRLDRKPEFALITSIYKNDNGQLLVVKRPANGHFSSHFNAIFEAPDKLEPLSRGRLPIHIIKPSPMGDAVMFPFIKGRSLERMLLDKVLDDDQEAVHKIIERFLHALDKLPSENRVPTDDEQYQLIFGNSFSTKCPCVCPAVVDLNLDNLIKDDKGAWHLIDYEWTFDFFVPKDYMVSRMLYIFFILRYQGLIRRHAARIKQVEVGEGYAMPTYIADTYDKWIKLFPEVVTAESSFQNYVLSKEESLPGFKYIPKDQRSTVEPPLQTIDDYLNLQQAYPRIAEENRKLSVELQSILSSKTYKLALRMSKVKRSISPRKMNRS